ncbi:hypothetical protein [Nitrosospira multiformis]|uniref:hypothetical protein n=1 Tax=Nitrosospira multiformis TaxID=1231 RepID=UPI0015A59EF9|nr:hypothetical protein [Nitrosospira multiformis]
MVSTVVAISISVFMGEANADEKVFSPPYCEFSVVFPNGYKPKEIISKTATGAAATGRAGSTGLSAECWPCEERVEIQAYARELASEMRRRGGIVDSVIIDRNNKIGEQIILTSRIKSGSDSYHIKIVSFRGTRTRLDLAIVDQEMASSAQINFRNSVKRNR